MSYKVPSKVSIESIVLYHGSLEELNGRSSLEVYRFVDDVESIEVSP